MSKNTIKIKKYSDVIEEYTAGAAILPGTLIELYTDNKVRVHSTSGGNTLTMFALEDELQGKGIDSAYATGDKVQCWIPNRGDVVLGILADGQSVGEGDFLESNGAGYLKAHTVEEVSSGEQVDEFKLYVHPLVGISLEEMDASADSSGQDVGGGLGVNKRIKVRIL
jgi:hypothetical protein